MTSKTVPTLEVLKIAFIVRSPLNPRRDAVDDESIAGLSANASEIGFVQYPVVTRLPDDQFQLIVGERRISAAEQGGLVEVLCLVHEDIDPVTAHLMRLSENMHRQSMHVLDEALALKIAWLLANADSEDAHRAGQGHAARQIMVESASAAEVVAALEKLLEANGFKPTRPFVAWAELLDRLGLVMKVDDRKNLMSVLQVDSSVHAKVRQLSITEAALRALGRMSVADQQQFVDELVADPKLIKSVRRISQIVANKKTHTLDEALDEVSGRIAGEAEEDAPDEDAAQFQMPDEAATNAIIALLELADKLPAALVALVDALDGGTLASVPAPWGDYATNAIKTINESTSEWEL